MMVEALLASDDELLERHSKAYQIAVEGQWDIQLSHGDAFALFLAAAIQARAIKASKRAPAHDWR